MVSRWAPKMVHPCPYQNDFDLRNFTLDTDLFDKATMMFPEGIYRCDMQFYFKNVITFNLSVSLDVKSSLKESFG